MLESGVRRRLPTTYRAIRNGNAHAQTLEHVQRRDPNLRIELIDETRDEKRDVARHAIRN